MQSGKKLPKFSDCICVDWYLAWGKLELSLLGTVLCLFSDSGKALAAESSGTPAFDIPTYLYVVDSRNWLGVFSGRYDGKGFVVSAGYVFRLSDGKPGSGTGRAGYW